MGPEKKEEFIWFTSNQDLGNVDTRGDGPHERKSSKTMVPQD